MGSDLGADFVTDNDKYFKKDGIISNGYGIDNIIIAASTKSNQPIELAGLVARSKGRVVNKTVRMDIPRKSCC